MFLGCSGYALPPKERCTHTLNLIPGDEVVDVDADAEGESRLLRSKRRCPRCGTSMDSYLVDEGRKLHVCGNNPDCPGFLVEQGEFRIKGYDGPVIECDKCGADMQLKSGRFGKYFGCTNTNCKNTRKLLRNGEAAPPKAASGADAGTALRQGRRPLCSARRRIRHISRGQSVPETSRNARADSCRA